MFRYCLFLAFLSLCSFLPRGQKTTIDGALLFEGNCADCHAYDLRKRSIGPALGNVHLQRDRAWLYRFISDSQALIRSGDPLANCVFKASGKALMPAFSQLTKAEIYAILDYIATESKAQGIGKNEIIFTACP